MSVLWRILSVVSLVVSAGILVLAIRSVRKEQQVRPGLDLARFGVLLGTTWLMGALLGVSTSEVLRGIGLLVGLAFGLYEGLHLRVRFLGGRVFARRSVLGILAWGLGVVVVQAAGAIDRIGLADLGLALSLVGIGQVVGLFAGRWQVVVSARGSAGRLAGAALLLAAVLAGAAWPGPGWSAEAADAVDVRSVLAGGVPGLSVEVRGNGRFYGPALDLAFSNGTGSEVTVVVPLGLQFLPENEAVQTMIAAGAETMVVPPPDRAGEYTTQIQAFCGQYHDDIPTAEDRFSAGEVATGAVAAVVAVIHESGVFGRDQQEALWQVTDGYDISANPAAAALVQQAGSYGDSDLTAGEGARTAVTGVGGAAALLATALAGSGSSLGSLAAAWRGGGWRGVYRAAGNLPGGADPVPAGLDAAGGLGGPRTQAALDGFPPALRSRVEEVMAARLENERVEFLMGSVPGADGVLSAAADPGEALRASPRASALLERLPEDVRRRLEERAVAGLQERRLGALADEAAQALRRDRAVDLVREAIGRGDGPGVQRVLAALGEEDRAGVWARSVTGVEQQAGALQFGPPGPGAGAVPLPDLDGFADADVDLGGAVPAGGEAEALLSGLPSETRHGVEARLVQKLEAGRLARWVEKLRGAATAAGGGSGGSVLELGEVSHLAEALPADIRDGVVLAAGGVVDGETVAGLAGTAHRLVEEAQAADLLHVAVGLGDGDQVDAILDAVDAALGAADEGGLESLLRRVGLQGEAAGSRLRRRGGPRRAVDLTEHLAGEPDLVAAVLPVEGVEDTLRRAGSLRPRVEAELQRLLETGRVERAVRRGLEAAASAEAGSSGAALQQLPGVREALEGLPPQSRAAARQLLQQRLEARRADAAVAAVEAARRLDRAEEALRRAAVAGDPDAADRALAGLTPEEVREVTAGAGPG